VLPGDDDFPGAIEEVRAVSFVSPGAGVVIGHLLHLPAHFKRDDGHSFMIYAEGFSLYESLEPFA